MEEPSEKLNPKSLEILEGLVETQKMQAENERLKIQLHSKELDNNHQYALRFLDYEKQLRKEEPIQKRKLFSTYAGWSLIVLVLLSVFAIICFYFKQVEFLNNLVYKAAYVVGLYLSFLAGRKLEAKKHPEEDEDTSSV